MASITRQKVSGSTSNPPRARREQPEAAIANALVGCLNAFIANEKFTEQMARKAEEEQMIQLLKKELDENARIREQLAEGGLPTLAGRSLNG
jgi:hypothetical protein